MWQSTLHLYDLNGCGKLSCNHTTSIVYCIALQPPENETLPEYSVEVLYITKDVVVSFKKQDQVLD